MFKLSMNRDSSDPVKILWTFQTQLMYGRQLNLTSSDTMIDGRNGADICRSVSSSCNNVWRTGADIWQRMWFQNTSASSILQREGSRLR